MKRQHEAEDSTWSRFGLPIGNGSFGAMLGGEVFQEVIQLNEETLFNGGPIPNQMYHHGNLKDSHEALKDIQQRLLNGENDKVTSMCQQSLIGLKEGYGSYQNLGELVIGYQFSETEVSDYRRELDLETAIHRVTFQNGENSVKRSSFISSPDQLFVHRFESEKKVDLFLCFQTEHPHRIEETATGFFVKGYLSDNHLQFGLEVAVDCLDGTLSFEQGGVRLAECSEVTLFVSAITDYAPTYPTYRQPFAKERLKNRIQNGLEREYKDLKARHLADYQQLFQRVTFDLGQTSPLPIDELIEEGGNSLAELLYHFGRYLLISSSRPGGLPSNLQGVWNETNAPPWGSDYHLNVNLQMNYWGAAGGNLLETVEPLVDYIEHLREPGRLTAAAYHGIISDEKQPENGFTAHTQTTPFGFTGPGWDFEWGWSPAAIPWILDNLYDTYLFTLNQKYLEKIYPMMREATRFFEQALVYNPTDGYYYSAPAYSPEHGAITLGNVYEHVLIQQLILNTIASATTLGVDKDQIEHWERIANLLRTEEVGTQGQLKEWFEETQIGSMEKFESEHRHVSHLLGIYPLHRVKKNGALGQAAEISLEERGLGTTGWSMIHRGLIWARLGNGEKISDILRSFFAQCLNENLFATHPPFQIDANLGYIALVQEALLNSQVGYLEFLPALPTEWSQGIVQGFLARGNLLVDFSWKEMKLETALIQGEAGQELILRFPESLDNYTIQGGSVIGQTWEGYCVRFDTKNLSFKRK